MRCLSDPVTVYRERASKSIAYPLKREKEGQTRICEPGNLLGMRDELPKMARHSTTEARKHHDRDFLILPLGCALRSLRWGSRFLFMLEMECYLRAMGDTQLPP